MRIFIVTGAGVSAESGLGVLLAASGVSSSETEHR